jgi:hypothetical protein
MMTDQDELPPAPPHPGPYYATFGPPNGPILRRDEPPALGVVADPNRPMPIGIAYPVGQVEHRRGPAATFRLAIGKAELEGRWLCVGREFVRLGEAAEEV